MIDGFVLLHGIDFAERVIPESRTIDECEKVGFILIDNRTLSKRFSCAFFGFWECIMQIYISACFLCAVCFGFPEFVSPSFQKHVVVQHLGIGRYCSTTQQHFLNTVEYGYE